MIQRELMLIETALETILRNEFYKADRAEIDNFTNDLRKIIRDKIKIEQGDAHSNVQIIFPTAVQEPAVKPKGANCLPKGSLSK